MKSEDLIFSIKLSQKDFIKDPTTHFFDYSYSFHTKYIIYCAHINISITSQFFVREIKFSDTQGGAIMPKFFAQKFRTYSQIRKYWAPFCTRAYIPYSHFC
jgi:hypothetical protein